MTNQRNIAGELASSESVGVPFSRLLLLIKNESTILCPILLTDDPKAKSCTSVPSFSLAWEGDMASSSLQFLCVGRTAAPNCFATASVTFGLDFAGDPFSPVWRILD